MAPKQFFIFFCIKNNKTCLNVNPLISENIRDCNFYKNHFTSILSYIKAINEHFVLYGIEITISKDALDKSGHI